MAQKNPSTPATKSQPENRILYPIRHLSGITFENFWKTIVHRQSGEFPRSEEELKLEFPLIKNRIEQTGVQRHILIQLASYILHKIESKPLNAFLRRQTFGISTSPSDAIRRRPERCQTPKHERTCTYCHKYIDDVHAESTCSECTVRMEQYWKNN